MSDQTFATHRRFDPVYHFVAFPLLLAFIVITALLLWKNQSLANTGQMILAVLLLLIYFKVRAYGLTVQDRIIRLEETLRMERLLPEDLKKRIPELRRDQFVGLRFASDGELPELVRRALDEKLGSEAIKKQIKTWRGDHFRV